MTTNFFILIPTDKYHGAISMEDISVLFIISGNTCNYFLDHKHYMNA